MFEVEGVIWIWEIACGISIREIEGYTKDGLGVVGIEESSVESSLGLVIVDVGIGSIVGLGVGLDIEAEGCDWLGGWDGEVLGDCRW